MENVYVGTNRPLKTIEEALFLKGNSNLNILLDEGEYSETITLKNASNINITGVGTVVFTRQTQDSAFDIVDCTNIQLSNLRIEELVQFPVSSGIDVNKSKSVFITRCIVHQCKFIGIRILNSADVHLFNNVISENRFGIYFYHSNGSIRNNTVVFNEEENISIVESDAEISKNITAFSKKGITVNNDEKERQLEVSQNLSFSNKENIEGYNGPGIDQTVLEFEDAEGSDYRISGKNYANIGATELLLQQFEQEQSEQVEPSEIKVLNADTQVSVFLNMSIDELAYEYSEMLDQHTEDWNIPRFNFIYSVQDLDEDTDMLLIINALDEFRNKDLIFTLIDEAQFMEVPFYVFVPSEQYEVPKSKINIKKLASVEAAQERLHRKFPTMVIEYNNLEDLSHKLYEKLQTHVPKITLEKLSLENIGHFENTEFVFDPQINCLVGLNGSGKTTVLRALGLGLIGHDHKQIMESRLENMLRIIGIDEDRNVQREPGRIALTYKIDDYTFSNILTFNYKNDGTVDVTSESEFEAVHGNFIKSLVIGFSQAKRITHREPNRQRNKIQPPHILDLIPLINNSDDNRLELFAYWIANLYSRAQTRENKILRERGNAEEVKVKERLIIEKVFDVIGQIIRQPISFKDVLNNEVWVSTQDAPEGVSLDLLGQGMQALIGWMGYFIQRLSEAYGNSPDFTQENAVCLVDEIDYCMHPRWQSRLQEVLRRNFPNTQFFFTTHSPLITFGLDREQIIKFEFYGNLTLPQQNLIDTWALSYQEILTKLFDTPEPKPLRTIEQLQSELQELDEDETERREAILENINRLVRSDVYKNELAASQAKLAEKEKELDLLITRLKTKQGKDGE